MKKKSIFDLIKIDVRMTIALAQRALSLSLSLLACHLCSVTGVEKGEKTIDEK